MDEVSYVVLWSIEKREANQYSHIYLVKCTLTFIFIYELLDNNSPICGKVNHPNKVNHPIPILKTHNKKQTNTTTRPRRHLMLWEWEKKILETFPTT